MATNSQPQETPEYRTFREHYDRLYHAIQDPLSLAARLFSQGIMLQCLMNTDNSAILSASWSAASLTII